MGAGSCLGSLLVYYWCRNSCDFCTLILYPEILLKLLISLRRFWAEMMGYSKYTIMLLANRKNLTSCFPNWIPFIYLFFWLIVLAKPSNTILNRSGERGHPQNDPRWLIANISGLQLPVKVQSKQGWLPFQPRFGGPTWVPSTTPEACTAAVMASRRSSSRTE